MFPQEQRPIVPIGMASPDSAFPSTISTVYMSRPFSSFNTPLLAMQQTWLSIAPAKSIEKSPCRLSSRLTSQRKKKIAKQRLACEHVGCKSTFPRRYELQRHENTIHKRTVSILCPIYGCNRASKPFPRLDKFREHFAKHRNPDKFLCLVEKCRTGPLTDRQLMDYLANQHFEDRFGEPHFDALMDSSPFLRTRNLCGTYVIFHVAERQRLGSDVCPLRSLGCNFRLSFEKPYIRSYVDDHEIRDHWNLEGQG